MRRFKRNKINNGNMFPVIFMCGLMYPVLQPFAFYQYHIVPCFHVVLHYSVPLLKYDLVVITHLPFKNDGPVLRKFQRFCFFVFSDIPGNILGVAVCTVRNFSLLFHLSHFK